jgi:putative DNA primase/helicase
LLDASAGHEAIARWWGSGVLYNIGIRTGEASGVVVVDVDPRHGGDDALAALERCFGALPATWRFLTGGGGEHILFRHPGRRIQNGAGSLGDGLDVRGDGGYIVGPGSRHISGRRYEISVDHHPQDVELADIPAWLMTMMSGLGPEQSNGSAAAVLPESWRKLVAEGVGEGRRNDAFVALDLVRCWNAKRCRPPLDEAEVIRTVNSIAARELRRRGEGYVS